MWYEFVGADIKILPRTVPKDERENSDAIRMAPEMRRETS
jgi:hypothetical protein